VLAGVLAYPLVTVRFDAVVSSYLGETAANLRRVFEFIQTGQWVVLFDEFDAIGKDRDNPFEHGELKRVVNTLLQLMDAFRGESLLVAATNHETLLDKGVWRRFEAVVQFPVPAPQYRVLLLRQFLRGFDTTALNLEPLAGKLDGATGADIERLCVEAARLALLEGRNSLSREDVQAALNSYRERSKITQELKRQIEE
jgi:SpoVK/Ycf46/Vps4 family AAA+-type ATPase